MHKEVRLFIREVKRKYPKYFWNKKVLEVGSQYINGSCRKYFWYCDYTGLDLEKGRCVDVVCHGADWRKSNYYDVVISCESMEHDNRWSETLLRMYENVREGGLMIMTCASTERPEHGTKRTLPQDSPFTTDYYRNISVNDLIDTFGGAYGMMSKFSEHYWDVRRNGQDLVFYGIKATTNATTKH